MPYQPDYNTTQHFTDIPPAEGAKNHAICNHCKDKKVDRKSLARKKDHLTKCSAYQVWLRDQSGDVAESPFATPSNSEDDQIWPEMPLTVLQRQQLFTQHFTEYPPEPGAKNHVLCNHCNVTKVDKKSLARKKNHLAKCQAYQYWLQALPSDSLERTFADSSQVNRKRPRHETTDRLEKPQQRQHIHEQPASVYENPYGPYDSVIVAYDHGYNNPFEIGDRKTLAELLEERQSFATLR